MFTGLQALKAGLIDQIGGEEDARAWLTEQKNVSEDLEIRTVRLIPDAEACWCSSIVWREKRFCQNDYT